MAKKKKKYRLNDPEFLALPPEQRAAELGISPMENAEINAMYTTAFAIYFLAQDAERLMAQHKRAFAFEQKQHFNNLIKALKTAKYEQDRLYEDYVRAWGSDIEKYTDEQQNANDLARLIMLWWDRVDGYHSRVAAVEKFIRENFPGSEVTDNDLESFRMKKL